MPATVQRTEKTKFVPLPDAPKPWKRVKPKGLHLFKGAISKSTRDRVWSFFHPKNGSPEGLGDKVGTPGDGEFPWYQRFKRFPKTAHFNGWHSGKFTGDGGPEKLKEMYPALYDAAHEAVAHINASGVDLSDVPAWGGFVPESFAVMRHKPGWGLGAHFDNAHDPGVGMVLMLTFTDGNDSHPRVFKFDDAPRGREFTVPTPDTQATLFGGECYDEWRHMSLSDKKQSSECISMTIRLAGVCGYKGPHGAVFNGSQPGDSNYRPVTGGQYGTGAPAAMRVAHDRIRKKMAIEKLSAECAKKACEAAVASAMCVPVSA